MSFLRTRDQEIFEAFMEDEYAPAYEILTQEVGMSDEWATNHLNTCIEQGWDLVADAKQMLKRTPTNNVIPIRKDCE